ncbi:hypothetical protein BFP97_04985 [Roseivirga sp. 4D4]|uniref:acyltransferase family protein n=1 Tax=Roseivirga sp. 4D4 TaxID=1889784 RepID=UPI0008529375|nr:acyltransferase [Roseivirga sp. 4D4]OEK00904.1 hypothetical protein BFP97_04985 [Roseivirga sp. 4D4]
MFARFFKSLKRDTSGKQYLAFVDGIRFIAIIPVVILHANERLQRYVINPDTLSSAEQQLSYLISRGAIGVMIFFALSGFILSLPFAKRTKSFHYKDYLKRRLTRLEPPYIFWMTLFGLILFFQSGIPLETIGQHYLASIFYVHNQLFGEFSIINPVAWSLEVEVQYYLIAPFIAIFYFKLEDIRSRHALLLSMIALFIIYQHAFSWQILPLRASILGQLQHFLIGMFMADVYANNKNWHNQKSYGFDLIGIGSIVLMMFTWTEELGKSLIFSIGMIGFFAACLKGRLTYKFLTHSWVSIIGGMCYTIYLTHLPLLELVYSLIGRFGYSSPYWLQLSISLILILPMVLLSSMIFYKCIEQPFMKKEAFTILVKVIQAKENHLKDQHTINAEEQ